MTQVRDPVCGMTIDSATAAGQSTHAGETFYFCSASCKETFDAAPERYAGESVRKNPTDFADRKADDPPYTVSGGIVAPKFGAAGSGGAEYEPLPKPD